MSYVVNAPELMASAATNLADVGSQVTSANAAAAAPTTKLLAAGADEVSEAVAALFSSHGNAFQAVSAKAAEFHSRFVQALNSAGGAYAAAEAANASPLQAVVRGAQGLFSPVAGELSLGEGIYGPGLYAYGRVFVEPNGMIAIGPGSTLNVAPGSEVIVGPHCVITIGLGSSLNVGHASIVDMRDHSYIEIGPGVPVTVGPNAELILADPGFIWGGVNHSRLWAYAPLEIGYSRVEILDGIYYRITTPVTISHGTVYGTPPIVGIRIRGLL